MDIAFKVDFLGIGPAKAGTTWVSHMLQAHPQICMSEPKEVHYFNDRLSLNRYQDTPHFHLGEAWYQKHFKHCQRDSIKGEITPNYILDPVVPERIYKHNPEMKIIFCIRSPFERIVSHYHSARDFHHRENRPFSQAIREEPEYIEACLYYKNISRFLTWFPREQFYVADMDRIKKEPRVVTSELYSFLKVDPAFVPSNIDDVSNPARATRFNSVRKWSSHFHHKMVAMELTAVIRLLKKMGIGKLVNRLNSAPVQKVSLTKEDFVYILNAVREDVELLSRFLEKDLSHWVRE